MNQILPFFKAFLLSLMLVVLVAPTTLRAQTKGMIVKPATGTGRAVLDPNGDGYVSAPSTPPGFKFNDVQESEIPYRALPLPSGEIIGDLLRGPSDGFSDFSYLFGNVDPVYTYLSNGNLMFRFRLGGIAPNAKGYSILIDTDNKFGNVGPDADPDYKVSNPGFEVEIVLATGFGVRLYNVDGKSSSEVGSPLVNLPYDQYAQKAVAYTTNGGSPDYFYDFYIPFSEITKHFPTFTASTPVRMVANTVMSAQHSALAGPISDVGGIDDRTYAGNYAAAFTNIIQNIIPTPLNVTPSTGFPSIRTNAPTITGTYSAGTSTSTNPIRVTGTSSEAEGTVITVHLNGTVLGTTTVGTGGAWSYTLPANTTLAAGDKLTATASAAGKSVSNLSNEAIVYTPSSTCVRSATPVIECFSNKGLSGYVPNGVTSGTIKIYRYGEPNVPVEGIPAIPVSADGRWGWNCTDGINYRTNNCSNGQGCITIAFGAGSYYAILEEGNGKCASARSNDICITQGNTSNSTTAAPTISTPSLTPGTTSISGTAVANSTVILLIDGSLFANTTATATGSWMFNGLLLRSDQVVTVRALVNGFCVSNPVTLTVQRIASLAPVVNSPIRAGATSISGTSTEPAGTIIRVFKDGQAICTTNCPVVDAYGNWTLTGIATSVLTQSSVITATATAPGKGVSGLSNAVTVSAAAPAPPAVPVITGSYVEGATAVSGTGPATTINLYIDGYYLGSVNATTTNWTISGLSGTNIEKLLYAGGMLTATSGVIGTNESAPSPGVKVQCSTTIPNRTLPVTATATAICQNSNAVIQITNSEPGISYTLRNEANTADLSSSVLGTGGTIALTSLPLTTSQRIQVAVVRGESPGCGVNLLTNSVYITVNPNPAAFTVTAQSTQVCVGEKAVFTVQSSQLDVTYQIRRKSDDSAVGSSVAGTGNQITLETPVLTALGSQNYYVRAVSNITPTSCGTQMSNEVTITVTALPIKTNGLEEGPSRNEDGSTFIIVQNSETDVLYQLLANGASFGTPALGNGGDISLRTDKVTASGTTYTVVATRIGSGCTVTLEKSLVLQLVVALPVELMSFKAAAQQNQVALTWSTASEIDNDRFEVERSQDGRTFRKIGTVKGRGTSTLTNHYSFKDNNPGAGVNYYRLRQVDFDGTYELSRTLAVQLKEIKSDVKAFPNPFTDRLRVQIATSAMGAVELYVLDLQGREVLRQQLVLDGKFTELELPMQQVATGVYFLKVRGAGLDYTTKLIKSL